MLDFFVNNWGTLLAGVITLAVVSLIIVKLIRDKKKGKNLADVIVGSCSASAVCHYDAAKFQNLNKNKRYSC